MVLDLAANLTPPNTLVTETAAFIGTRGSGKTYAAGVLAEEIAYHNQLVVLDPVGVWYGLRLTKDGKALGVPIAVFGGDHADVPLAPSAGEMVAAIVAARRINVVLDVSPFTIGEMHRFSADFATHLFQLKKAQRSPLHLILEEAHEFLPQVVGPREAEMVGAFKRLWKIGRNYGIGGTLVSQRPAELNKGALNLTERMFCGRLKGPQDRKAIEGWARDQDADMDALDQLATLPNGELVHWTDKGVIRVRFREKRTFDASKTPEAGDITPTAMPMLGRGDLDIIRDSMASYIEEAKANNPRALRDKVRALEAELEAVHRGHAKVAAAAPPAKTKELIVYRVPDRQPELLTEIGRAMEVIDLEVGTLAREIASAKSALGSLVKLTDQVNAALARAAGPQRVELERVLPMAGKFEDLDPRPLLASARVVNTPKDWPHANGAGGDDKLPKGARAMLAALASSHVGSMTRRQIATLSGMKVTGGTFAKYLGILKGGNYLDVNGAQLQLTEKGRAAAGEVEIPLGRDELLAHWSSRLPAGAREMLNSIVLRGPPDGITRTEWAMGLSKPLEPSGGTFAKYLGILVTRGLVEKRGTRFVPAEMFS